MSNGNKIVAGVFWRFGEKITAQLVSFLVSVVLARLLKPEDYGLIAIVLIFVAIAEVFVTSGLGTALIQRKEIDQEDASSIFWINLIFSIILYLLFFFIAPLISLFYKMPELTIVLRVLALRIPVNAINSIQNAIISKRMDFKKFFFATIIGTVVSAVVGLIMAYCGFGVWSLVAQILVNTIIDTVVLSIVIKWKPSFVLSIRKVKPLISYGWKILATDLIGTIFNQLNAFLIGKKYSSTDLAYYTQGKKIPDIISGNIGSTLCSVLFPAMSLKNSIEEIKNLRRKCLKMMEYVIFPLMFGMFIVADKMILVVFTEKWAFSIPYVRITCIASMINVLGSTFIQEIKAIGRSDITLKMEIIKKPVFLVIALVSMQLGIKYLAFTLIVNEIVAFFFNVHPVRKYIGFEYKIYIMDLLPNLLITIIMGEIVYILGLLIKDILVCLIVQVVTGIVVYVILSLFTKNESFFVLYNTIFNRGERR